MTVKINYLLVLFLVFAGLSSAQITHTGYAAPECIVTPVHGKTAVFIGGKAMWVFNNSFGIGGSYYSVLNDVQSESVDPVSNEHSLVQMSFGGIHFEYFLPAWYGVEHSLELLCAGGGVKLIPKDSGKPHTAYYGADLLVWMPRYNVQFRIAENWKLSLGAGYRNIGNFKGYYEFDRKNMSSFLITIGLRGGNN